MADVVEYRGLAMLNRKAYRVDYRANADLSVALLGLYEVNYDIAAGIYTPCKLGIDVGGRIHTLGLAGSIRDAVYNKFIQLRAVSGNVNLQDLIAKD